MPQIALVDPGELPLRDQNSGPVEGLPAVVCLRDMTSNNASITTFTIIPTIRRRAVFRFDDLHRHVGRRAPLDLMFGDLELEKSLMKLTARGGNRRFKVRFKVQGQIRTFRCVSNLSVAFGRGMLLHE
jgi:hypothetical protein